MSPEFKVNASGQTKDEVLKHLEALKLMVTIQDDTAQFSIRAEILVSK